MTMPQAGPVPSAASMRVRDFRGCRVVCVHALLLRLGRRHGLRDHRLQGGRRRSRGSRSTAPTGSTASPSRCTTNCATRWPASATRACVVLTGAGRGFCAGQDLNDRAVAPGEAVDLGDTVEASWNPLIRTLAALPQPVIARVNGVAAGAGANIALACDLVIAAKSAKFIQSFSAHRPDPRQRRQLASCRASSARPARSAWR